jgi:hypothetical protein
MLYNQSFLSSIPKENHSIDSPYEKSKLFKSHDFRVNNRNSGQSRFTERNIEPNRILGIFAKDIKSQKQSQTTTRILQRIFNIRKPLSETSKWRDEKIASASKKWSYADHIGEEKLRWSREAPTDNCNPNEVDKEREKLEILKAELFQESDFHMRSLLKFINDRQNTKFYQIDELMAFFKPNCILPDVWPTRIVMKDDIIEAFTPNTVELLNLVFDRSKNSEDSGCFSTNSRNLICQILALKFKN